MFSSVIASDRKRRNPGFLLSFFEVPFGFLSVQRSLLQSTSTASYRTKTIDFAFFHAFSRRKARQDRQKSPYSVSPS